MLQFKEKVKKVLKALRLGGKAQIVGSYSRGEPFSDVDANVKLKPTQKNLLALAQFFQNTNLPTGLRFVSFKAGARNRDLWKEWKRLQKRDQWSQREVELASQLPYQGNQLSVYLWLVSSQPDILFHDGVKLDFDFIPGNELPDGEWSIPFTVVYQFRKVDQDEIIRGLQKDLQTKVNQGKWWKAMKRLHSLAILQNDRLILAKTKPLVMQGKNSITERLAKHIIMK